MLPIFFRFLPLREDFEENAVVFNSFLKLFEDRKYKDYLVKAVEVVLLASINKQVNADGTYGRIFFNQFNFFFLVLDINLKMKKIT